MRKEILLMLALPALAAVAGAQTTFTVENPSMAAVGTAVAGWDTTSAESRANGPFNATVAHQAIDSAADAATGSGSVMMTFTGASGSLTQSILLNATGQEMQQFHVDIAHSGQFTALLVGLYQETVWDVIPGYTVDVIASSVPADTDGTLDTFTTVSVIPAPGTLVPNSSNPMRFFVGTAGTGAYGAATVGAKVAIDNIRVGPLPTAVDDWMLY